MGEITLAKSYSPYGEVTTSVGDAESIYAYTGEQIDASGLTYLRARYYNPLDGRFLSRDTWEGDVNNPLSLNRWMYVEGNPVNYIDPTGHEGMPPGQVIAYCFGVAVVVVVDGPSLELLCALAAATIIGTIGLQQNPDVVEEVIEDCVVTWEQLLNNVAQDPNPNQEPEQKPTVTPPPPPIPTPQPTPTKKVIKKHISLGQSNYLGSFTANLNMHLIKNDAMAFISEDWQTAGLSDTYPSMLTRTFHLAFKQAVKRAEHIHFNLQGIPNKESYAQQGSGDLYSAEYVTAWELYNILNDPIALKKTTFYPNGFISGQ